MRLLTNTLFILMISFTTNDSLQIIKDYPLYNQIENNKEFIEQFNKYMEFSAKGSPDGKKVFELMQMQDKTLDVISTIFHEKVELMEWMNLKHKYEDIMNPDYNRAHYMEVYPVAHRKAVIEEIGLIKYFAMKKNFPNIPEVAYNMTSPLIEFYNVTVERMQGRLKFNQEYLAQVKYLTRSDIETAIKVYEAGGHAYADKDRLISDCMELIKKAW